MEEDHYVRMLMHVVGFSFRQNRWEFRLRDLRINPRDLAAKLIQFLARKTKGGMNLKNHEPLVLMRVLYTSLQRVAFSEIKETINRSKEVLERDYFTGDRRKDKGGIDGERTAVLTAFASPDTLTKALAEADDFVVGGIVCRSDAEYNAAVSLFEFLRDALIRNREFVSHDKLPPHLKYNQEVSLELHGRITSRLARFSKESCEH